jgi:hypothetical protein
MELLLILYFYTTYEEAKPRIESMIPINDTNVIGKPKMIIYVMTL